jgi:hypothetical protein
MARIMRSESGKVRGLTRAQTVPLALSSGASIRDIAWRGPAGLAVLTGPSPQAAQVLMASVDGSTPDADTDTAEILRRRGVRVVSSPSPETSMFVQTAQGRLYELGTDGAWVEARVQRPLGAPTFAG